MEDMELNDDFFFPIYFLDRFYHPKEMNFA